MRIRFDLVGALIDLRSSPAPRACSRGLTAMDQAVERVGHLGHPDPRPPEAVALCGSQWVGDSSSAVSDHCLL